MSDATIAVTGLRKRFGDDRGPRRALVHGLAGDA